ncbi:MAG: iron ABC transporter permease [Pseudomonadota bacterium]
MASRADTLLSEDRAQVPARVRRQSVALIVLAVACAAAILTAFATGAVPVSLGSLLSADPGAALERTVFIEIRSPRVILAAFVGAALSLAGAVLQGLFRNPLADPQLIGVSGGAALGAVVMIVLGANLDLPGWASHYAVPGAAVIGAMSVTAFLYLFSRYFGHYSTVTMILVGIAINAIATVGVGAMEYLSSDTQLRTLVFWMMGSFGRATWPTVLPAIVVISLCSALLLRERRRLDLLQLGEQNARHLGVDTRQLTRRAVLSSAAIVGAGVAISGIIGFVGLIVPHLVRLIGGASNRFVLPGAALLGATLMVAADVVARTVIVPAEIPVGLVTSAIGGPFFLWLIARVRPR